MDWKDFTIQILPYQHKLFRLAVRIVGNEPEAEDIVQEVFIKLWNKRDEWHTYRSVEAWCVQLTKNLSIDKLRSKHRKTEGLEPLMHLSTKEVDPHRQAELSDSVHLVERLMQSLPEKQRIVLQLRDVEEMTYKEVAEALEITVNQVKVNLHRARQSIKKQLINQHQYGLSSDQGALG